RGGGIQFAPLQRVEQVAREDDPLALPTRQPFVGQMPGACFHRFAYFRPKTAAEIATVARQVASVEPCRARRGDLFGEVHVRTHGESYALTPLAILKAAQFDDRARPAIAGRLDIGKPNVMGAPVDPIDDGV